MTVMPIFAWYDMWIGFFWCRKNKRLYVFPLPCIGFVVEFQQHKDKPLGAESENQ